MVSLRPWQQNIPRLAALTLRSGKPLRFARYR
jgi:hypothetical protein